MAGMLERDIEKVLVTAIKAEGGRAYKFKSPGNAGVPDRLVCLPGGFITFVELKTENGKLTELQDVQIRRLKSMGQSVYVAYGISGIVDFLHLCGLHERAEIVRRRYEGNVHL